MTFPATPLDLRTEIDAGGWTDISDKVYTREPVQISRGRDDEESQASPVKAKLTINNADGNFSPRNPLGTYYGLIGRNTPIRISVPGDESYMRLPGSINDFAYAPDTAGLSITGDIDVRIDVTLDNWRYPYASQALAGKYEAPSNQRSWAFELDFSTGLLKFYWSPDGTLTNRRTITSTKPAPTPANGRQAVRATLDVNNGASGVTATFYYADDIDSSWTQLGDAVTSAGTSSIFDSTAFVTVGEVLGFSETLYGVVHAFELRAGIGGTVKANPDFRIQTAGAASFADAAGNTWTLAGAAEIDDRDYRFWGEVSSWPPRWDVSGKNVWTSIEASGVTRRLGQGTSPLRSPIYRTITGATTPYDAYWPMEDNDGSTSVASGLANGRPMKVTGSVSFTTDTDSIPAGSAGAAMNGPQDVFDYGLLTGEVVGMADTGGWAVSFWVNVTGTGINFPPVVWRTPGASFYTIYTVQISTAVAVGALDDPQTSLITVCAGTTDIRNAGPTLITVVGQESGANVAVTLYVNGVADGTTSAATSTTAAPVNSVQVGWGDGVAGTVSHLVLGTQTRGADMLADLPTAGTGNAGEAAGRRLERLCNEQGIPFVARGDLDNTVAMGPQRVNTFLALARECVDADMGILFEPRDRLGLGMRTRASLYNQASQFTLDYVAGHVAPELEPVDDDQQVRNDVTVTRPNGSSYRVQQDDGPLSVADPPDGVGRYDTAVPVNIESDDGLPDQARFRLHLGTTDEARYPTITAWLHAPDIVADPDLAAAIRAADAGDRVAIDNPPAWLPPDEISQILQGQVETLEPKRHIIEFNCTPESPWRVAVTDAGWKVDTDGSATAASFVAGTGTSLSVAVAAGALWTTDAAEFPLTIRVSGVELEVTAISGASSPQTFTITQAPTNGVEKTIPSGSEVRLAARPVIPL